MLRARRVALGAWRSSRRRSLPTRYSQPKPAAAAKRARQAAPPRSRPRRSRPTPGADAAPRSADRSDCRDLDRQHRRRRRRRRPTCRRRPRKVGAAAAAAHAPSRSRGSSSSKNEADAYEKGAQGLPRRHHPHRPAPLRRQAAPHARGARRRDRRREEGPARGARRGHQAPRGVRRALQRPQRAPREHARRDVPPRRALRGARPQRQRPTISPIGLQARDRALQARHQRVSEVPRARGHLLLPRPRAQRLEPHPRGAAGVALARLPQQLSRTRRRPIRRIPSKDTIVPLPQDHDEDYWTGWENAHPTPIGFARRRRPRRGRAHRRRAPVAAPTSSGETTYVNPYPDELHGDPAEDRRRARSRATSPRSGGRSATGTSTSSIRHGGPLQPTTAPPARTRRRCKFKKPPLYGVAMYKHAWTHFKQQRYETAVHAVRRSAQLHRRAGEAHRRSGRRLPRRGLHVHRRLAHEPRLQGPRGREPYIPRNDILDTEPNPHGRRAEDPRRHRPRAGSQAHPAGQEVDDRDLQGARAGVPRGSTSGTTPSRSSELILKKWPMNRDAPEMQNPIADIYDQLTRMSREGTPERDANAAKALEARTKLADYIGNTPWVDANKDNPEAIQTAERLVRGGLRRAAADHTNNGSAPRAARRPRRQGRRAAQDLARARAHRVQARRRRLDGLPRSRTRTRPTPTRAATGSPTRATTSSVVIGRRSTGRPPQQEIDDARQRRVDVRDSNEDDKYLEPAAFFVVDVARAGACKTSTLVRRIERRAGDREARRGEVRHRRRTATRKVVSDPIPPGRAIAHGRARRVRAARPAAPRHPEERRSTTSSTSPTSTSSTASSTTRRRASSRCGRTTAARDEFGYKAWEKLITMAARSRNVEESRRARRGEKSSTRARSPPSRSKTATELTGPVKIGGAYIDAGKLVQGGREDEGRPGARTRSGARPRRSTSRARQPAAPLATKRPKPR